MNARGVERYVTRVVRRRVAGLSDWTVVGAGQEVGGPGHARDPYRLKSVVLGLDDIPVAAASAATALPTCGGAVGASGRVGLVVSARWLTHDDDRTCRHEAAEVIADTLYDPVPGACEPARAGPRVLRDPPKWLLEERIREAFAAASLAGDTLVLYLIGHGSSDFGDDLYHFIPADHPAGLKELPTRGYPLGARQRARHDGFPGSDGMIALAQAAVSSRRGLPPGRQVLPARGGRRGARLQPGRPHSRPARRDRLRAVTAPPDGPPHQATGLVPSRGRRVSATLGTATSVNPVVPGIRIP